MFPTVNAIGCSTCLVRTVGSEALQGASRDREKENAQHMGRDAKASTKEFPWPRVVNNNTCADRMQEGGAWQSF